ncbi:MAG: hypothetical protein N2043_11255 [Ignavibacterium sp.]|nr:hypothetical protein [Ignavibacterium sp.]
MKRFYLILVVSLISLWGCEYFENSTTLNSASLELNITGLPQLPDTMAYVAWFDTDDRPAVFIKQLSPNAQGNVYFKEEQKLAFLDSAQIFLVTVERKSQIGSANFAPSSRIVLIGRFSRGLSNLSLAENFSNFQQTSAKYTLYTPTDGNISSVPFGGIWFVDSVDANRTTAGLNLPVLSAGWIYEGWIEVSGNKLSTGRFRNPKAADLFNGFSASAASIPFPGEDFLNNAPTGFTFPLDLRGKKAFVSLELNDGRTRGTTPLYVLFEADIPNDAVSLKSYPMSLKNVNIPKGTAVIKVDLLK